MKVSKTKKMFLNMFGNTKKLLSISWRMDKKFTFLYFFTVAIGSIMPVLSSIALAFLIDSTNALQSAGDSLTGVVVVTLAAIYIISILEDIILYGFNYSYLDYLYRYKIQNAISLMFYKKVANLDIAHFENTDTQDLITKTRDTMQWRVPDYIRHVRDLSSSVIVYLAAFIVLIPFGIWVPIIITIVTLPRIYLRAKHGALQWSI